jgi:hypothetical protein
MQARAGLIPQAPRPVAQSTNDAASVPTGIKLVGRRYSNGEWSLALALPDFSALADQLDLPSATLDKARFSFFDKPEIWMPGRALRSYSHSHHALSTLPNPLSNSIITFQDAAGPAAPLAAQLQIGSQPPWLLRIHADGIARQVLGNHVRTGEDYILAATDAVPADVVAALSLQVAPSRTAGAVLHQFRTPESISQPYLQALSKLKLGYSLQVKVTPVGLVPRWDEAQSCSVWLPNEEILLRLSADFPVAEFSVVIDGQQKKRFSAPAEGSLVLSLGPLPLGQHN